VFDYFNEAVPDPRAIVFRPGAVWHAVASCPSVSAVASVDVDEAPASLPGNAPTIEPVPALPGMVKVPSPAPFTPPKIELTAIFESLALNFCPDGAVYLISREPTKVPPGAGDTPERDVQLYSVVALLDGSVVLIFPARVPVNAPLTAEEVQLKLTPEP
jgi:hypothetical protein